MNGQINYKQRVCKHKLLSGMSSPKNVCRKQISKKSNPSKKATSSVANDASLISLLTEQASTWFSDPCAKEPQQSMTCHPRRDCCTSLSSAACQYSGGAPAAKRDYCGSPGCSELEESWPEDDEAEVFVEERLGSEAAVLAVTHAGKSQQGRAKTYGRAGNGTRGTLRRDNAPQGISASRSMSSRTQKNNLLRHPLKQGGEPNKKVSSGILSACGEVATHSQKNSRY